MVKLLLFSSEQIYHNTDYSYSYLVTREWRTVHCNERLYDSWPTLDEGRSKSWRQLSYFTLVLYTTFFPLPILTFYTKYEEESEWVNTFSFTLVVTPASNASKLVKLSCANLCCNYSASCLPRAPQNDISSQWRCGFISQGHGHSRPLHCSEDVGVSKNLSLRKVQIPNYC